MTSEENVVMNNIEHIQVPVVYGELMFNIINVVAKRGAILPNEFKPVGELHDFLMKVLRIEERIKEQQAAQQAAQQVQPTQLETVQE